MNAVINTIKKRRSIRFYEDKPVPKALLEQIIDAGNLAPTGSRQQWRFVVVTDKGFRGALKEKAIPRYESWMERFGSPAFKQIREPLDALDDPIYYNAPAIIFIIGIGPVAPSDTPLVAQNVILAAESLGLGTCYDYFGQLPIDDPEVKERLALEEGETICGPILVGYPSPDQPPAIPKKSSVVSWI